MARVNPRDVRRGIGCPGRDVRLLALPLCDNLNTTKPERDGSRLMAALDFAGPGPFVRNQPRGLDLNIHEMGWGGFRLASVSGGLRAAVVAGPSHDDP